MLQLQKNYLNFTRSFITSRKSRGVLPQCVFPVSQQVQGQRLDSFQPKLNRTLWLRNSVVIQRHCWIKWNLSAVSTNPSTKKKKTSGTSSTQCFFYVAAARRVSELPQVVCLCATLMWCTQWCWSDKPRSRISGPRCRCTSGRPWADSWEVWRWRGASGCRCRLAGGTQWRGAPGRASAKQKSVKTLAQSDESGLRWDKKLATLGHFLFGRRYRCFWGPDSILFQHRLGPALRVAGC